MPHCTGVIAEYNPFHNGHRYQLEKARSLTNCEHIAVAMSGAFVQRGEVAMFDKFTRAKWALQNGADIVLELPTAYACATAERFAEGAVRVLAGAGFVDALCFGSESGDVEAIERMAALCADESDAHREALAKHLKQGLSFPAARAKTLLARGIGQSNDSLALPNDILGIEYVKAIRRFAPHIAPYAVKRVGAPHDAAHVEGAFASASALRRAIREGDQDLLRAFTPETVCADILLQLESGAAPYLQSELSDAVLYALRRMPKEALARLEGVGEGLENVLYRAAREASDAEELLGLLKTKRYTLARLRRILMAALLGVERDLYQNALPYLRVLGVKKEALGLLSALSKSAVLPVVTRYLDASALPDASLPLHELDLRASDIAPLALKARKNAAFDYAAPLLIV